MRSLLAAVALIVATSPATMPESTRQGTQTNAAPVTVSVDVNRTTIDTRLGGRFSFTSTVRNLTEGPKSGLIAHLNVFSTDPDTYIDPEDWSSHRTQFLDTLASQGSVTLTWPVQAVNSGPLILYVAVTDTEDRSTVVSPPIELTVTRQQTINSGGILPLALGVPAAVAALLGANLVRRRQRGREV